MGLDENCNGVVDEDVETAYYYDGDADGWGDSLTMTLELHCTRPARSSKWRLQRYRSRHLSQQSRSL